jgi:tetratricopeptide (TPR) repeat protein
VPTPVAKSNNAAAASGDDPVLGLDHADEAVELFSISREASRVELAREEINLGTALIAAKRFAEAEAAARRAIELAPNEVGPHIVMIAALHRENYEAGLERFLREPHAEYPDIIASPLFQERLERDPDFIGVADHLKAMIQ